MFNTRRPNLDDLPSHKQLVRSTKRAGITAAIILVTVVFPAEYGIDVTGVGWLLGLKEMGVIKQSLLEESQQQEVASNTVEEVEETVGVPSKPVETVRQTIPAQILNEPEVAAKTDSITVTLVPNGSAEVKAKMSENETIEYSWTTDGGALNYSVHGEGTDPQNRLNQEYTKGLNKSEHSGSITAAFDGTHGWFWRNRSGQDVTVTLRIEGEFESLKKL